MSGNRLIARSEYSDRLRPGQAAKDATTVDVVSIINLDSWLELACYDALDVLDRNRRQVPYLGGYPELAV